MVLVLMIYQSRRVLKFSLFKAMDLCGINLNAAEFVAGNRLEVPSLKLLGIIVIISFGVMLTGIFSLSYDDFSI